MGRTNGKYNNELNAEPISPMACEVVFDALARSQSGIVDKQLLAERRAALQRADGSLDREYMERALTGRAASGRRASESNARRAAERNEIRNAIRGLFPRRECRTLVRPVVSEDAGSTPLWYPSRKP